MQDISQSGILVIGFGNPGRCDDGLGPALADRIAELGLPGVTVESDYQLTVEDADAVARHAITVFADADVEGPGPFRFAPVHAGGTVGVSSHDVEPEEVVALAECLFRTRVRAYLLRIRGYEFGRFEELLSEAAAANLGAATAFIADTIRHDSFDSASPDCDDTATASTMLEQRG